MKLIDWFQHQHPGIQMMLGFLSLILMGTILLLLPVSTPAGKTLTVTDAVFTATSAVCVTGLIVVQTPVHFTWFGQLVIMTLFQLGGIGIILGSTLILMGIRGSMGMDQRFSLQKSFLNWPYGRVKRALFRVFTVFFGVELGGTAILTYQFSGEMNLPKAFWHGLFHSISAVCNAGFSLNTDSIVGFAENPVVVLTVAIMIIFGGLGFVVIAELLEWSSEARQFSLHTRTILMGTTGLIVTGALAFLALEPSATWLDALFQSITARTAGFNSVDIASWGTPSLLILMLFMFIGAGPASTAGGIKITTIITALADMYSRLKQQEHTHWLNRRLPQSLVNNSIVLVAIAFFLIGFFTFCLSITETAPLKVIVFEVFSALGTVGLSLGITTELTILGKWIIILAMFLGRLGPLTFALVIINTSEAPYTYPEERLMIG